MACAESLDIMTARYNKPPACSNKCHMATDSISGTTYRHLIHCGHSTADWYPGVHMILTHKWPYSEPVPVLVGKRPG